MSVRSWDFQLPGRIYPAPDEKHAVNINGTDLYRPLSIFGEDMRRVVGRSSMVV